MKITATVTRYCGYKSIEISRWKSDEYVVESNNLYDVVPWIAEKICTEFSIDLNTMYCRLMINVLDDTHLNVYSEESHINVYEDIKSQIANLIKAQLNNRDNLPCTFIQDKSVFILNMYAKLNNGGNVLITDEWSNEYLPSIQITVQN
jgi:hypothetical protein